MRISKLKIENYRNLDGVAISFDEDVTYIVGENNLAKRMCSTCSIQSSTRR